MDLVACIMKKECVSSYLFVEDAFLRVAHRIHNNWATRNPGVSTYLTIPGLLTRCLNTMAQFILVLACCQLRYSFTLAWALMSFLGYQCSGRSYLLHRYWMMATLKGCTNSLQIFCFKSYLYSSILWTEDKLNALVFLKSL